MIELTTCCDAPFPRAWCHECLDRHIANMIAAAIDPIAAALAAIEGRIAAPPAPADPPTTAATAPAGLTPHEALIEAITTDLAAELVRAGIHGVSIAGRTPEAIQRHAIAHISRHEAQAIATEAKRRATAAVEAANPRML